MKNKTKKYKNIYVNYNNLKSNRNNNLKFIRINKISFNMHINLYNNRMNNYYMIKINIIIFKINFKF